MKRKWHIFNKVWYIKMRCFTFRDIYNRTDVYRKNAAINLQSYNFILIAIVP